MHVGQMRYTALETGGDSVATQPVYSPSQSTPAGVQAAHPSEKSPPKRSSATWIEQTTPLASLQDAQIGGCLPVVSLPLHPPATGWDASGILKRIRPRKPLSRKQKNKQVHPNGDAEASSNNPLHGPTAEMVFRAGFGRTHPDKAAAMAGRMLWQASVSALINRQIVILHGQTEHGHRGAINPKRSFRSASRRFPRTVRVLEG